MQTTEGRVYLYSLIIGCVGIGAYAVTTVMINSIGNRNILSKCTDGSNGTGATLGSVV